MIRATRIRHLTLIVTGLLLTLGLTACADTEWPKWITGEPTRAELNSYSGPIAMPALATREKEYPNLADVPARPKITLTNKTTETMTAEMAAENAEGHRLVDEYKKSMQPVTAPAKKPKAKTSKKKTDGKKTGK